VVEDTRQFAHIVEQVYASGVHVNKYVATFTAKDAKGFDYEWSWMLSPRYTEFLLERAGHMEYSVMGMGSDTQVIEKWVALAAGPNLVTIEKVERQGDRGRPSGEFFPFYVAEDPFQSDELDEVLQRLQIHGCMDDGSRNRLEIPENYNVPCIVNALTELSAPEEVMASMRRRFKRGRISCVEISKGVGGRVQ
jgi:hypothetical protein